MSKKRTKWTKEEEDKLKELYSEGKTYKEISTVLNRSLKGCGHKIRKLNLCTDKNKPWTKAEENKAKQLYKDGKTYKEIGLVLDRPSNSCRNKIYNWTKKEDAMLKKNYGIKTLKEISLIVNRSIPDCWDRINTLNIIQSKPWTEKDLEILLKLYNNHKTFREISIELNRSLRSCEHKIRHFGINKRGHKKLTIGKKYNNFTVLKYSKLYNNHYYYLCKCKCGHIIEKTTYALLNTKTTHCSKCYSKLRKRRNDHYRWSGYKDISGSYFNKVKTGAEKRELKFNLSIKDMWNQFEKQNGICALSGIQLKFPTKSNSSDGTASLDRIDSSKGYIKGNIQWVHKHINKIKWEYSQEYFIELCKKVAEHNDN